MGCSSLLLDASCSISLSYQARSQGSGDHITDPPPPAFPTTEIVSKSPSGLILCPQKWPHSLFRCQKFPGGACPQSPLILNCAVTCSSVLYPKCSGKKTLPPPAKALNNMWLLLFASN